MSIDNVKKAISIINQHQDDADFDGAKDEQLIVFAEKKLGVNFPDGYRFFLKNLGCGDIAGQEFYGVITDDFSNSGIPDAIWLTLKERQELNLPDNYIIIGSTGDGDYIVLDCIKNNVLLWSPGVKDLSRAMRLYYDDFGDFFLDQIVKALN
ncbi:SMI1/KNR4 family protein [Citrobacter amalonaticus]|uniref:SMI1/KNR4 family protein n=1 Tax=Citrobacter amalonaticus TaxID=35703 RepID=UPI00215C6B50|nr:SMI1/KNR4 family protein [Citrobacter amalonaticus]MCR9029678.1 SMI1/KNR4 family protein [Citrobacter amalonaticus]